MKREINTHKTNGCNDELLITAADQPGSGGANHRYEICGFHSGGNPSEDEFRGFKQGKIKQVILFQNGPVSEDEAPNGVTNEALLAILIDRMEGFQSGQFACNENQIALDHLRGALVAMHSRTKDRLDRGVEGKLEE